MSRFKALLAVWIMAVWTLGAVNGVLTGDYQLVTYVSPVVLLMGGYYFGQELVDRLRARGTNGNGNGK